VSPVKYELGFYIQEDEILLSHRRKNLGSYTLRNFVRSFNFPLSKLSEGHWACTIRVYPNCLFSVCK
jgi:hypothetical protein